MLYKVLLKVKCIDSHTHTTYAFRMIRSTIATYERSFGTLKAIASQDTHYLAGQRLGTIFEAYRSGLPGFVDRGTMTTHQVLEYIGAKLAPATQRDGAPSNGQPIDVMLSRPNGPEELIATSNFGETRTHAGLIAGRSGRRIAHVDTFAVSGLRLGSEALTPTEMTEVALALGHATLTAATANFDEISYRLEGTTTPGVMAQLAELGLADNVVSRDEIAQFASSVTDVPGMVRTEFAVDIKTARDALEATYPWLAATVS